MTYTRQKVGEEPGHGVSVAGVVAADFHVPVGQQPAATSETGSWTTTTTLVKRSRNIADAPTVTPHTHGATGLGGSL